MASAPVVNSQPAALYEKVKTFVRQKSRSGEWKAGDRIPSENEMVRILGISRMTINRALKEMAEAGELTRIAGVGTFLAGPRAQSTLLMIARIGEEVRARGNRYSWSVTSKETIKAARDIALALEIGPQNPVHHLICIHFENDVPVQLEDRYVNPACAPYFLRQTFVSETPSEYLLDKIPVDDIEHTVESVTAGRRANLLQVEKTDPCLLLTRRTWSNGVAVTFVRLYYPASRYRLSCRFRPSAMQDQA